MTPILHGYIPRRGRGIQDCVAIAKRAVTRECKATRTDATHLDATRTSPSLEMIPPSLSSSPPKHAGRPLERVFVSRREQGGIFVILRETEAEQSAGKIGETPDILARDTSRLYFAKRSDP